MPARLCVALDEHLNVYLVRQFRKPMNRIAGIAGGKLEPAKILGLRHP